MDERIYLDTYLLQQDMRVRLPKSVISNLGVEKGKTKFDIYLDSKEHCLIFEPTLKRGIFRIQSDQCGHSE